MFSLRSWHRSQCVWALIALVINHAKWHTIAAVNHQPQLHKWKPALKKKCLCYNEQCLLRLLVDYRFNFPCSAPNLFTMFSSFKNIRWGPAATQMLWTRCYGSLLRPHLWLKGFFVCWQNLPQLLSHHTQRQASDNRAPCDKPPPRQQHS